MQLPDDGGLPNMKSNSGEQGQFIHAITFSQQNVRRLNLRLQRNHDLLIQV